MNLSVSDLVERECLRSRLLGSDRSPARPAPVVEPAEWTVLVYANGKDGALSRLAPGVLRELEAAGSDSRLSIVAQVGRKRFWTDRFTGDWSGTRRYEVQHNPNPPKLQDEMVHYFLPPYTRDIISPVAQDLGERDMGSKQTFQEFLEWGIRTHPAKRYAVVVYGQGGGFTGALRDASSGSVLGNDEVAQALGAAAAVAGKRIDLLALDASSMGQMEVAAEFSGSADRLVASESPLSLGSLPLDLVMKDLKFDLSDGKEVTADDLARWFVFEARYQPTELAELTAPSLVAVDLDRVDALNAAWSQLAHALTASLAGHPERVEALREDLQTSLPVSPKGPEPQRDFRDVASLCNTLKGDARLADPAVQAGADAVLSALGDAVVDSFHAPSLNGAGGLSVYLPSDYGYDMPRQPWYPAGFDPTHGYGAGALARDTEWDETLRALARDTAFHQRLRDAGLSDAAIHGLDTALAGGLGLARLAADVARRAGHYESYRALRNQPPGPFMGMSAEVATRVGAAGGGYEAFQGARKVYDAATRDDLANRTTMAVDGGFEFTTGAAVVATAVGLSVAAAQGIARPAAAVAFAVPIARTVYDLLAARKNAQQARDAAQGLSASARAATAPDPRPVYISPTVRAVVDAGSPAPIPV